MTDEAKIKYTNKLINAIRNINEENQEYYLPKIEKYLQKGADANVKLDPKELTCADNLIFFAAIIKKRPLNIKVSQLLLQFNANPDATNRLNNTLLNVAARDGDIELVKQLLNANAKINGRNKWGETALMHAIRDNQKEVVTFLLKLNANVHVRDTFDNTALVFAAREGATDIVEQLLQAGANIDVKNNLGDTAVMAAKRILMQKNWALQVAKKEGRSQAQTEITEKIKNLKTTIEYLELAELRKNAIFLCVGQNDSYSFLYKYDIPLEILARIAAKSITSQSPLLDSFEKKYNAALFFFRPAPASTHNVSDYINFAKSKMTNISC